MELELGLGLPQYYSPGCLKNKNDLSLESKTQKRSFSQAFQDTILDQQHSTREKPLLVSWGDKPNKEDDGEGDGRKTSNSLDMSEVEENHVVGWPPINSWRKKLLWRRNKQGGGGGGGRIWNNNQNQAAPPERGSRGVNASSSYVKVKMDGVAIGRKIDLELYDSYETLKRALIDMFAKYHTCNTNSRCYSLTYQDRDGDWMLAGDVPWKTFVETARRLEIVKTVGS